MPIQELIQEDVSKGLPCLPGKVKTEYCDTRVIGLRVDATAGGTTYYFARKEAGRRKHYRLASTEEITLDAARKIAVDIRKRNLTADTETKPAKTTRDL